MITKNNPIECIFLNTNQLGNTSDHNENNRTDRMKKI